MAITDPAQDFSQLQYGRNFSLTVADTNLNGLDLSALRVKFSIKRSNNMTPNVADIRVYNLSHDTAIKIKSQFKRVIMQGGYDSNHGVIFQGNIKQVIIGRESATDTFVDLNCGDGDLPTNYAVVNTAVKAGSSQSQILNQITQPMSKFDGMTVQSPENLQPVVLPRGVTMWGSSKDFLRTFSQQNQLTSSIQNNQLQFVPQQGYGKGEAVVLTSKTGMIGTPQQTNEGVNVQCLMNPRIQPNQRIKIDNASVAALKIDLGNPKDPANSAPQLTADGLYYVLVHELDGDTRSVDWYSKLRLIAIPPAGNPINSVQITYGP